MVRIRRPNIRGRVRGWRKARRTKKLRKMTPEKRKAFIQNERMKKIRKQERINAKRLKKEQKLREKQLKRTKKEEMKRLKKADKEKKKALKKKEKEKAKKLKKKEKEKAKKQKKKEGSGVWGTLKRHKYLVLAGCIAALFAGYAGLFGKSVKEILHNILDQFWQGMSEFFGDVGRGIVSVLLNPWVLLVIGLAIAGLVLWWYLTKRHQVKVKVSSSKSKSRNRRKA